MHYKNISNSRQWRKSTSLNFQSQAANLLDSLILFLLHLNVITVYDRMKLPAAAARIRAAARCGGGAARTLFVTCAHQGRAPCFQDRWINFFAHLRLAHQLRKKIVLRLVYIRHTWFVLYSDFIYTFQLYFGLIYHIL